MKTRYCGHLYSSLLRKRTWWGHRDQVSYYMEGGLKGTEVGSFWLTLLMGLVAMVVNL